MAGPYVLRKLVQQCYGIPIVDRNGLGARLVGAYFASQTSPRINVANPTVRLTNSSVDPIVKYDSRMGGTHYHFNGINTYLRQTSFLGASTFPVTISVKFKAITLAAGNHTIVAITASGGTSTIFQVYTAGNVVLMRHYNSGTTLSETIAADTIYTVTAVFDSTTSRKLYLNGKFITSETTTGPSISGHNQLDIGASPWAGPGEFFDGYIGAPLIFNRALTLEEIRAVHENPWAVFRGTPIPMVQAASGGLDCAVTANQATSADAVSSVSVEATVTSNQATSGTAAAAITTSATVTSNQATSTSSSTDIATSGAVSSNQAVSADASGSVGVDAPTTVNQAISASASASIGVDVTSTANQVTSASASSSPAQDVTVTSNQVTSADGSAAVSMSVSVTSNQVTSGTAVAATSMSSSVSSNQVTSADASAAVALSASVSTNQAVSASGATTVSIAAAVSVSQVISAALAATSGISLTSTSSQVISVSGTASNIALGDSLASSSVVTSCQALGEFAQAPAVSTHRLLVVTAPIQITASVAQDKVLALHATDELMTLT